MSADGNALEERVYRYVGRGEIFHFSWLFQDVLCDDEKKNSEESTKELRVILAKLVCEGVLISTQTAPANCSRPVESARPAIFFKLTPHSPREFREKLEKLQKIQEPVLQT